MNSSYQNQNEWNDTNNISQRYFIRKLPSPINSYQQRQMYHTQRNYTFRNIQKQGSKENVLNLTGNEWSNRDSFPMKEIAALDFEKILNAGNKEIIEKYLPKMIYHDFNSSQYSSQFITLISTFQNLLKYLFDHQTHISDINNQSENLIQNDLNLTTEKLEQIKDRLKSKLSYKSAKIQNLNNKLQLLKAAFYSTGNQDKIPHDFIPFNINEDKGMFYCEICPGKMFRSYEEIHKHYVKRHFQRGNMKNINYNSNYENILFEKKLETMKKELQETILGNNDLIEKELNDRKDENMKTHFTKLITLQNQQSDNRDFQRSKTNTSNDSITMSQMRKTNDNIIPTQSYAQIDEMLKDIEMKQDKQFNEFKEDFNTFKEEIYKQLHSISLGEKVVPPKLMNKNYHYYNVTDKNKSTYKQYQEQIPQQLKSSQQIKNIEQVSFKIDKEQQPQQITYKNKVIVKNDNDLKELYVKFKERDRLILFDEENQYRSIETIASNYEILPNQKGNDKHKIEMERRIKILREKYYGGKSGYNNNVGYYKQMINLICNQQKNEGMNDNVYERYKDNLIEKNSVEEYMGSLYENE